MEKNVVLTNNNLPNPLKVFPQCCFICCSTCFANNQCEGENTESDHEYFSFTMHVDFNLRSSVERPNLIKTECRCSLFEMLSLACNVKWRLGCVFISPNLPLSNSLFNFLGKNRQSNIVIGHGGNNTRKTRLTHKRFAYIRKGMHSSINRTIFFVSFTLRLMNLTPASMKTVCISSFSFAF